MEGELEAVEGGSGLGWDGRIGENELVRKRKRIFCFPSNHCANDNREQWGGREAGARSRG